jgi:intracellular sulfur oxidation DsrE/DsrF family protein
MKRLIPLALALVLSACAEMPTQPPAASASAAAPSGPNSAAALAGMSELKMAFDVVDGSPGPLLLKLNIIDLTRKQLIEAGVTPKIVISFRGEASYYTQTDLAKVKETDRADALAIRAKLKELSKAKGVQTLEQCNVPLASRKIKPADVMQEVHVVGNGWISLAAYQSRGYSYIAP